MGGIGLVGSGDGGTEEGRQLGAVVQPVVIGHGEEAVKDVGEQAGIIRNGVGKGFLVLITRFCSLGARGVPDCEGPLDGRGIV